MDAAESSDSDSSLSIDDVTPAQASFKTHVGQFAYSTTTDQSESSTAVEMPATRASRKGTIPFKQTKSASSSPASTPRPNGKKRGSETPDVEGSTPTKKRKTSAKERSINDPYRPENKLVDSLRPGLTLVMIGLNPGLETARTGHAYAHFTNLFWRLLHESGITPKRHLPSETHDLQDLYSIGNTNICARPSRDGGSLSKEELQEGAKMLEEKIRKFKPEAVAVVGKQIWETVWRAKTGKNQKKEQFKWGWQDEDAWLGRTVGDDGKVLWSGARTFVTTSTSGLAAGLKPAQKLEIWRPLGEWFTKRRKELEEDKDA